VVRGFSFFGASFVYVIFEDGTDIYWARSRVLEYLTSAAEPPAAGRHAAARAGRDRRGLGLPVRARRPDMSLAELRSLQDWYVRYQLTKAQGVAEVASVGGFVRSTRSPSIRCGCAQLRHHAR
jgi:Cu(I)/Ag(I) efflux system membrane protein CusA/SilA